MGKLQKIKELVQNNLYYLTEHAVLEAEDESISIYDIESAILNGKFRKTWPNQGKYEIIGKVKNSQIGVICRITRTNKVRVITVYLDNIDKS